MTNNTSIAAHGGIPVDIEALLAGGNAAGGGWWAALTVLIVLIAGGWLMQYFIGENREIVKALRDSNTQTVSLLAGVIRENTQSHNATASELHVLKDSLNRVEQAVVNRMSIRRDGNHPS